MFRQGPQGVPHRGRPGRRRPGTDGTDPGRIRKPLIAAVEGAAVAGGFELALACDLVTAADTAFFALPEVARGLIAAEAGAVRLPGRLPHHLAMELLLTAAPLPAATAARYGLVNQLTSEGKALDAALALAARVQAHSPQAVRVIKQIGQDTHGLADRDTFAVQDPLSAPVFGTASAVEGSRAFTEQRPPRRSA
ncbi:enoyl-CoA hydratase-related protein [Streptomyces sp. NPDC101455]|uniref:enoyl-CoA hydratase-related protein n=1 Tax=Streptomyces sp. NPDC101455 TaxID=3366142 RepID=UPI00381D0378